MLTVLHAACWTQLKGFLTHLVPEVTIHKRDTSDSEECKTSAAQAAEVQRPSTTAMQSVEAFITALNAAHTDDARVTIRVSEQGVLGLVLVGMGGGAVFPPCLLVSPGETRLKCIMLDPAIHFREVVDAARSVIVAGGTMQPVGCSGRMGLCSEQDDHTHHWLSHRYHTLWTCCSAIWTRHRCEYFLVAM